MSVAGDACRIDRRTFLTRSAAGGVALSAGHLLSAGSALAGGSATGYGVGQRVPKVVGLDQYDRSVKLSRFLGPWLLLDISTVWCPPCNAGAAKLPAFIASVNADGLPLKDVTVLAEGQNLGTPSVQSDAEQWAVRWGYERTTVIHAGGSPSAITQLASKFAKANGGEEAYPCYVLIDPQGFIRYVQNDSDMERLKRTLAELAATPPLSGSWPEGAIQPGFNPRLAWVTASYGAKNGARVSETVAVGATGKAFTVKTEEAISYYVSVELGFPAGGFPDLTVPVKLSFHANFPRAYESARQGRPVSAGNVAVLAGGTPILYSPNASWVTNARDGTTFGLIPFTEADLLVGEKALVGPDTLQAEFSFVHDPPFYDSIMLAKNVAEAPLPPSVQSKVAANLQRGTHNMTHRNFVGAAAMMLRAVEELESAGSNLVEAAEQIAAHVAWLANN